MDTPVNPMVITSLIELARPISREALERLIVERLLPHERFRQRVAGPSVRSLRPTWELDPLFDLRSHVHHVALPAPGGPRAMEALVSDLMSTPLDHHKPLWQVHLIDDPVRGSALVVRLHHCIADGVSLVRLLLELSDEASGTAHAEVGLHPPTPAGLVDRLHVLGDQARTLAHLLMLPPEPPTPLQGALGVRKRAAWTKALPLGGIVAIAHRHNATVNDVLLAATTGALRRHLDSRQGYREGLELRLMMPVNLRRAQGAASELGNQFGLVYVSLPLGVRDPAERLSECKRRLDGLKSSPDATVSFSVLGAMGFVSASAEQLGVDLFTLKATALATNVPGPSAPVSIAGVRVANMLVWAPVSGRMGMSFSFLSYAGNLTVGLGVDERLVPDPDSLLHDFTAELAALDLAAV